MESFWEGVCAFTWVLPPDRGCKTLRKNFLIDQLMYFRTVVVVGVVEVVGSTVQEQVSLWMKQGSSDDGHWKRTPSSAWKGVAQAMNRKRAGSVEVRSPDWST